MKPLRAYLLVRRDVDDWDTTVHRDLESLMEAWQVFAKSDVGAVVHVGFWRPETSAFENVTAQWNGFVLLTAPAKYAFPAPCAVAPCQVGEVEGLPLYVALHGWGYETTAEHICTVVDTLDTTELKSSGDPFDKQNNADWFTLFMRQNPDLAAKARMFGVTGETSYLSHEPTLPNDLRERIGLIRFEGYAGTPPTPDAILDKLRFAPPWLLSLPISVLDLSVRSNNCLLSSAVSTIGKLAQHGEAAILRFPNLGRKSLSEIKEKVTAIFVGGLTNPIVNNYLGNITDRPTLTDTHALRAEVGAGNDALMTKTPIASNIEQALFMGLAMLDESEMRIMRLRMGFEDKSKTLQEIGDVFGVTRERIRQKEARCISKMARHPIWHNIEDRLVKILTDRQEPLPLLGLEIIDPWFTGAEHLERPLDYTLSHLCAERFSLIRTSGQILVSELTQLAWDDALKKARHILEGAVDRTALESEVHSLVDALLVGAGEELRPELWANATRWANFVATQSNSGERVLVSYGFGAESIVEAVLMESDRPLHYTEISRRCRERLGRSIEVRRAHQSAANVGLLYGRGTYGLMKHFPLSDPEARLLVSEVENLIEGEGNDTRKQWHAREISEAMEERGLDFGDKLTPYIVSIALERSKSLANLGRMIWALKSTGARGSANRIDVHQAVVSLLISEGHPMRSDEIRERIARDRGLNCFFQIQPEGSLVRVGPGIWGLIDRDLPFSADEGAAIVEKLINHLRKRGKGLHVSEIRPTLMSTVPQVALVQDPVVFLGLAQKDRRCSVDKGQYVFLREWGTSHRLSVLEAVRRTLEAAGSTGLTLNECVAATEALVERPLPRHLVGYSCGNLGATYDEISMRWILSSDEEAEESDLQSI